MPAVLDTTNDVTSFIDSRDDAWHQLGFHADGTFDALTAMEKGYLGGWDVRKLPLYVDVPGLDGGMPVPKSVGVLRTNPVNGNPNFLGIVGENYQIIQNEQHADFLNTLVDESGAHFETAGALEGGRRVFITMKLPGHIRIGGKDQVDNYLAAVNSHDGSMSFTLMVTPVRIVCKNTLNLAFANMTNSFKIRHTSGAERILRQEARAALDMTFAYLEDGLQVEADRLINRTLTTDRFEEIISREFGAPEDAAAAAQTRADHKIEKLMELFADARTQEDVRETAWGGLMALTEYYDHFSPTRGTERDTARATKSVLSPGPKNRALELMKAV